MLTTQNVEVDDIFESVIHSYFKAETGSCVFYYIIGYVSRYLKKSIKCDTCLLDIYLVLRNVY